MNTKKYFALKRKDRDTVDLYCEGIDTRDGYTRFQVLNGGWTGRYYSNGNVTVDGTGDLVKDVEVVWQSEKYAGEYNSAMYKINLELGYITEVTE